MFDAKSEIPTSLRVGVPGIGEHVLPVGAMDFW